MNELGNIFSGLPKNDAIHGGPSDAVLFSEHFDWGVLLKIAASGFGHLLIGNFGIDMGSIAGRSSFADLIQRIVGMSPQTKMSNVHATRIVTRMHHNQTAWNWTMLYLPRNAMRCIVAVAMAYVTIARAIDGALPGPARVVIGWRDTGPKLFFYRGFKLLVLMAVYKFMNFQSNGLTASTFAESWGIMGLHKNLQFLCQAWDVSSVARHFLLVCTPVIIPQGVAN